LTGQEVYSASGQSFMRYRYDVFNKNAYPAAMFAAAPDAAAVRQQYQLVAHLGRLLRCAPALASTASARSAGPQDLGQIWFSRPEGDVPPSYVYIELIDRQTGTRYRSNLADHGHVGEPGDGPCGPDRAPRRLSADVRSPRAPSRRARRQRPFAPAAGRCSARPSRSCVGPGSS
jgi:hypothetical protein